MPTVMHHLPLLVPSPFHHALSGTFAWAGSRQHHTSASPTPRSERKMATPSETRTAQDPDSTPHTTPRLSPPTNQITMPVASAPPSTSVLMAIMACIRVGGGGSCSDHGS